MLAYCSCLNALHIVVSTLLLGSKGRLQPRHQQLQFNTYINSSKAFHNSCKPFTKTLDTGNKYLFFNTTGNPAGTEQHGIDLIHLCTASHAFSPVCLACSSHCYIIAETISSPNCHMNIKWQDLQEKINHHHKVYRGKKKKEVGNFTSELTFKCDSATQTLDSNRKNLVNENGFFPFPVLIFMQSQWNNPNSFFPTLNIFLFCSRGLLTARYFTGPLNKQRMTIEKKKTI